MVVFTAFNFEPGSGTFEVVNHTGLQTSGMGVGWNVFGLARDEGAPGEIYAWDATHGGMGWWCDL